MTYKPEPRVEVVTPLFQLAEDGSIIENPLFHRPWDKLHSRCVEYPFAASNLGDARRVLDVGTAKADPVWISWLEHLPIEVHAIDYDDPVQIFDHIKFHQCDVRDIPLEDATFDKIFAVSVIEHIGLDNPQVLLVDIPELEAQGDVTAIDELARLLKPGGELIMTMPFGLNNGLISGGQARNYTSASISTFCNVLSASRLEYYEYQHKEIAKLFVEYPKRVRNMERVLNFLNKWLGFLLGRNAREPESPSIDSERLESDRLPGVVTWRRIPLAETSAEHDGHIDGVLCGVWKKSRDP